MWKRFNHGLFVLLEKLLRWSISPRLRARLLALLGAHIGHNVRIHEVHFFNLSHGFGNLHIDDNVHVGPRCLLDLEGDLHIGARSTLSPGVTVLTHNDPGSAHEAPLSVLYPPRTCTTRIGADCWVGTSAVLLAGVAIGNFSVIGAGSIVISNVPDNCLVAGNPARMRKRLEFPAEHRDWPTTGKEQASAHSPEWCERDTQNNIRD